MANKIQQRRGLKADMPTGSPGELLYATDTREMFVGTGSGNVNMSGSHWYRGTAMSGTSATANQYSYSACPEVKLNDIYMNTSNGNIYACTTAGKGTNAKWTYQGCMKGLTGPAGTSGKGISSTAITYASYISGVTAPTSWQSTIPSVSPGSYLWTRLVITYTDGTTSTSYSVARQGVNGSNATVTIDSALSSTSVNPVQNKVVTEELRKREIIVTNQSELEKAIQDLPTSGGKIILGTGSFTVKGGYEYVELYGDNYGEYEELCYRKGIIGSKSIIFIGQGKNTIISIYGRFSGDSRSGSNPIYPEEKYNNKLSFKDSNIILRDFSLSPYSYSILGYSKYTDFNFDNCDISTQIDNSGGVEVLGCNNLILQSCNILMKTPSSIDDGISCVSGFDVLGNILMDKCNIIVDSTNLDGSNKNSDFEVNLIYNRNAQTGSNSSRTTEATGTISNCYIVCKGDLRTNIVNNGNLSMVGNIIILKDDNASISHYNDSTTSTGSFVGNYVEYYGTYMRFATISGNTFDHKLAGTSANNQMILLCPTAMTGNHFKGSSAYIDGQSKKHIIDRNFSDNGITVGNAASGSVTTNNITY